MRRILVIGLITLAMVAMVSSAQANLILNGSFETGTDPGGTFIPLATGSTAISGWTVDGSIDYIGGLWTASDGLRSIDLNGTSIGSVSQTFGTVSGQTYTVVFDMAGNPGGPLSIKALVGSTGSVFQLFTFDATGNSFSDMGWETKSFNFTATGSTTTLTFASSIGGSYGPALDNVSVPEPGTLILLGSGLLGLVVVGRKKFHK